MDVWRWLEWLCVCSRFSRIVFTLSPSFRIMFETSEQWMKCEDATLFLHLFSPLRMNWRVHETPSGKSKENQELQGQVSMETGVWRWWVSSSSSPQMPNLSVLINLWALSFSLSHFRRHIDTPVMSALKYMRLTSVKLSYNVLCI